MGVEGADADGGFFQPLPLQRARIDTAATRVRLRAAGSTRSFSTPNHFLVESAARRWPRSVVGETVFAGTVTTAERALSAQPVAGRIIVLLGVPDAAVAQAAARLARRGAAAVLLLIDDAELYDSYAGGRSPTRYSLRGSGGSGASALPVVLAGPLLTRAVLGDVPAARLDAVAASTAPAVLLPSRAEVTLVLDVAALSSANVAAIVHGTDPERVDELVVFTAHYDHLGIGPPGESGDSIYNGFSDNAAGTAMLLEIASAVARAPPPRSVLFLFFAAEEVGLLGSSFYVASPLLPLERIRALINLDAGAPPAPPVAWRLAGGARSTFGARAAELVRAQGYTATLDRGSPNSDYWPFLARGVPAIFLVPGQTFEGLGGAAAERLREHWDRYHRPDDHWHADFPFAGLKRYAELALRIGIAAARR
ncbi:MAG: M28 family peptidase [Longimicrobiales bacterium]